jgi:hypothetical protein
MGRRRRRRGGEHSLLEMLEQTINELLRGSWKISESSFRPIRRESDSSSSGSGQGCGCFGLVLAAIAITGAFIHGCPSSMPSSPDTSQTGIHGVLSNGQNTNLGDKRTIIQRTETNAQIG